MEGNLSLATAMIAVADGTADTTAARGIAAIAEKRNDRRRHRIADLEL